MHTCGDLAPNIVLNATLLVVLLCLDSVSDTALPCVVRAYMGLPKGLWSLSSGCDPGSCCTAAASVLLPVTLGRILGSDRLGCSPTTCKVGEVCGGFAVENVGAIEQPWHLLHSTVSVPSPVTLGRVLGNDRLGCSPTTYRKEASRK